MECENKQLRVEYAGCQKSLRLCRKKLQTERNNFRKLILAVSERLEQSSLAARQVGTMVVNHTGWSRAAWLPDRWATS
jgi:hypothetical protein